MSDSVQEFAQRRLTGNRYVLLCLQYWTPDDGQRNCPKHVEFYSKNKSEKLVHLFGFRSSTDEIFETLTWNNKTR